MQHLHGHQKVSMSVMRKDKQKEKLKVEAAIGIQDAISMNAMKDARQEEEEDIITDIMVLLNAVVDGMNVMKEDTQKEEATGTQDVISMNVMKKNVKKA